MPKQRRYPHPSLELSDAKLTAEAHKSINQSLKLLQQGTPDTFLGRQTYKPFSVATEEDRNEHK